MEDNQKTLIQEIIKTVSANPKLNYKQIAAKVKVFDRTGREQIKSVLQDLVDSKVLKHRGRGKYTIHPKFEKTNEPNKKSVIGTVDMKPTGKAYIIPEDKNMEDIFIQASNVHRALHGDIVKVLLFPNRKNRKPEGEIVEIIERSQKQIVGTIRKERAFSYFIPDSANMPVNIIIPNADLKNAQNNDKVVAKITDWSKLSKNPFGSVTQVLGKQGDNNVEMNAILAEFEIPLAFPEAIEQEAAKIDTRILDSEINRRRDFRNTFTITIDP